MPDAYQAAVQAEIDAADTAAVLNDKVAVALAGSFYKDFSTGQIAVNFGPGWREILRVSPPGGYDGIALYHAASQSLVVVNRGTEGLGSLPDWLENIGAALFNSPGPQMDSALQLLLDGFEQAGGPIAQLLICGHSLGGALADVQGAMAQSLFASKTLTCPPVRVVGVASAGFAHAARILAAERNLAIDPAADHFITHYVRAEDYVPHHPGRSVFGRDQSVASIYEARWLQEPGPRGGFEWQRVADSLRNHSITLYHAFFDDPGSSHVWYTADPEGYATGLGAQPAWSRGPTPPDNP